MKCALSLDGPQTLNTVHINGKQDYTLSHLLKKLDGYLFANVPDILHTTHNYNSDTILYSHFLQCALDFICIAPAVVLLWLLSSILRKYIIILTPHQPLEASLVGC